jgi:hypothetical protein
MDSLNGKRRILSVAEAQEEAKAEAMQSDPELLGPAGLKRNASKEYVLTAAAKIAMGACERTYNVMGAQQALALEQIEAEFTRRLETYTLIGNLRRFARWLDQGLKRVTSRVGVVDADEVFP